MCDIKVWDIFIRIFHWSMVVIILANFTVFDEGKVHEILGYALVGLLLLRLIWGFIGTKYARFSEFFPTPTKVKAHIAGIKISTKVSHIGHNPLGAVMIYNIYITLILLSFTGWLAITDHYWGVEWVEEIHEFFSSYLLFSLVLHVLGVILESIRTGVNLISAMISGIKKIP